VAKRAAGLTARQVETLGSGLHGDGNGLYLQVGAKGARSWIYRFVSPAGDHAGKRRDKGLGSVDFVGLSAAREAAYEARRLVRAGTDPIDAGKGLAGSQVAVAAKAVPTFEECAEGYIATMRPGWRSSKHGAQWPATLRRYVYPVFGSVPVTEITTSHVLQALTPIWSAKNETASRVRGRIERILDSAKVRGHRSGENPARWTGNLALILPAPGTVSAVEHHASLPYQQMAAFWPRLQMQDGMGARALELAILCASRTSEVLLAQWGEFDITTAVWRIPGARMKAGADHRIPLAVPALTLLRKLAAIRQSDLVFSGQAPDRALSNMAMAMVLRRMKVDATPHGFRSTFKTWAAETTAFPHEVSEAALAHTQGDKVVAAYQRGDLFEKRRELMNGWAAFLEGAAA
jgi:integrase